MKYSTIFLLTTLSVLVLSYGMSSLAYGQGNVAPINVKTDHAAYGTGEIITIFGFVKDYDGSNDVVIQVFAPNGNLASVAQISPDSDGNYSIELTAAGMISLEGEYIVKVQIINNGPQRNQTIFEFVKYEEVNNESSGSSLDVAVILWPVTKVPTKLSWLNVNWYTVSPPKL